LTNKLHLSILFAGSLLCLLIAGVIWRSYSSSKNTADIVVGSSSQYFELSKARLVFDPTRRKVVVWYFQYSHPTVFDADFEIYTTLFGDLYMTNPTNLYDRLRANEKKVKHPYASKEESRAIYDK